MTTIHELITYDVTSAAIAEMAAQYMPLRVHGFEDAEGYAQCKEARTMVRSHRLAVEKRRVELKRESLEFGRLVDSKAKDIFAALEPIETHLLQQIAIVDDEKKRREEAAAKAAIERIEGRIRTLAGYHYVLSYDDAARMSDEDFAQFAEVHKAKFEAQERQREEERQRLAVLEAERAESERRIKAAEEENRRLQQELIEKQRAELAAQQAAEREAKAAAAAAEKRLQEERAKVEAERKAAEKAEQERQAKAAKAIKDQKAFEALKAEFPTLEACWVEIHRLRKFIG